MTHTSESIQTSIKKGVEQHRRVLGVNTDEYKKKDINTDEFWDQYKRVLKKKGINTDECWDQYKRVSKKGEDQHRRVLRLIQTSIEKREVPTWMSVGININEY